MGDFTALLNRRAVLVAEDEPFIALDLAFAIEDAGGEVVGPVASVKEALVLLSEKSVAAAILDVNLIDGDISPVVDYLMERNVPLILQTGVGLPPALALRFPDLIVRIKPTQAPLLIVELEALLKQSDGNNDDVLSATGQLLTSVSVRQVPKTVP